MLESLHGSAFLEISEICNLDLIISALRRDIYFCIDFKVKGDKRPLQIKARGHLHPGLQLCRNNQGIDYVVMVSAFLSESTRESYYLSMHDAFQILDF